MNATLPLYDIGIVGLGAMGSRIAARVARCGHRVVGYDRDDSQRASFEAVCEEEDNAAVCVDLSEFCSHLTRPRRILMMVPSGVALDGCIQDLLANIEADDVLIDGGNSHFEDTLRRARDLEARSIGYIGMGISGGVEVETTGPCIMAGGSRDDWESVRPIFEAIAAVSPERVPACAYLGPGACGHYVKMVHNGIEYAEMQLIAEAYWLLRTIAGLNRGELQAAFSKWNDGPLRSYLVESTARILSVESDDATLPIVDKILDRAGQKGTGQWTIQSALDLGVPVPTLAEAVFARYTSSRKSDRETTSRRYSSPRIDGELTKDSLLADLESALYASRLCASAQGFQLLHHASNKYEWKLDLAAIAGLWRAGCIITSDMMATVESALEANPENVNLLVDPEIAETLQASSDAWRRVVQAAIRYGIPTPALSSALQYFDSYRSANSPANMIQAQRDYFGKHGFEWVGGQPGELHHIDWPKNDE